jgi:DMSO/TMAO reductase YedYZ molybdopterin-dependent catalytic subunit
MGLLRRQGLTDEQMARIPPGQHRVTDFPVLHVGAVPYANAPTDWDLRVFGLVENPMRWDFGELRALPKSQVTCDIHCVTSWSKLDTAWEGVSMSWLLDQVKPLPSATHVLAHADPDYTTNMPLDDLRRDDVLLAYRFDGQELEPEHGRPLRLLVPHLYFWKSAKWLRGLEFLDADQLGFWERYGYSNTADPWKEERYAF